MDGFKKPNGLPVPISKERKEQTNAMTRRKLFDAHASLGEQIKLHKELPITEQRAVLLAELDQIVSLIERVYLASHDLNDETPFKGAA